MSQTRGSPAAGRGWLSSALRSWWFGSGAIPTTRAGAEDAIVIAFLGLRLGFRAEVVPASRRGLERTTSRPTDLTLLALALTESITICVAVVRYLSRAWPWVDVAVSSEAFGLDSPAPNAPTAFMR